MRYLRKYFVYSKTFEECLKKKKVHIDTKQPECGKAGKKKKDGENASSGIRSGAKGEIFESGGKGGENAWQAERERRVAVTGRFFMKGWKGRAERGANRRAARAEKSLCREWGGPEREDSERSGGM